MIVMKMVTIRRVTTSRVQVVRQEAKTESQSLLKTQYSLPVRELEALRG